MAYTKYSLTPGNNTAAPPDGAPEGMLPSAVNDTMRDMMAQIRDVGDGIRNATYPFTAGTVSAPSISTTGDSNTGIYFPAADTIAFTEGGAESMRIDSSGNVGIGLTPTSRNNTRLQIVDGIGFPATQISSSDANTLDDYEEGTWTPVVTSLTGSITTYTSAGQYRKIGSLVVAQFQYGLTNNGTGATAIALGGLPFAGTTNTAGGLAREIAVTGVCGGGYLSGTTTILIVTAAGAYMGGTGWQVVGTISYQAT